MLRKSFLNYVPRFFEQDEKLLALSNKIDTINESIRGDITGLKTFIDIPQIPQIVLNDIGDYLNAGLIATDSDRTKREKIYNILLLNNSLCLNIS